MQIDLSNIPYIFDKMNYGDNIFETKHAIVSNYWLTNIE